MTPMLTNFSAPVYRSGSMPAHTNAMAYASLQTLGGVHHHPSSTPTLRQQRRKAAPQCTTTAQNQGGTTLLDSIQQTWKSVGEMIGTWGLPGAEAATPNTLPPKSVQDLVNENRRHFQIQMGPTVNSESDLRGQLITIGIADMSKVYKAEGILRSLNFDRGDLVVIEGYAGHCESLAELGVPKESCVPLANNDSEITRALEQAQLAFIEGIKSSIAIVVENLPDSFFERFGYKILTEKMHVDQMLDFISQYESMVVPEATETVQRKLSELDELLALYNQELEKAATQRHRRMTFEALQLKTADHAVVMITDARNAAHMAPDLYQLGGVVMVDKIAANKDPKSRLPQPQRERTDL